MAWELAGIRREMGKLRAGPSADQERSFAVDLCVVGVGRADSSKNLRPLLYRHARTERNDTHADALQHAFQRVHVAFFRR